MTVNPENRPHAGFVPHVVPEVYIGNETFPYVISINTDILGMALQQDHGIIGVTPRHILQTVIHMDEIDRKVPAGTRFGRSMSVTRSQNGSTWNLALDVYRARNIAGLAWSDIFISKANEPVKYHLDRSNPNLVDDIFITLFKYEIASSMISGLATVRSRDLLRTHHFPERLLERNRQLTLRDMFRTRRLAEWVRIFSIDMWENPDDGEGGWGDPPTPSTPFEPHRV